MLIHLSLSIILQTALLFSTLPIAISLALLHIYYPFRLSLQQSRKINLCLYKIKIGALNNNDCNCISRTMSHAITYILNKCEIHLLKWNPWAPFNGPNVSKDRIVAGSDPAAQTTNLLSLKEKSGKHHEKKKVCISPLKKMNQV